MPSVVLTLLAKPGCHLCDDARGVIDGVLRELAATPGTPDIERRELSILDDPALYEAYAEEIPVVLIDGRVHNIWRVDAGRLRRALLED